MEIIIATIGLELGILSQDMFSIIVVMAMATSLMAPPALRWVLAHVSPRRRSWSGCGARSWRRGA
jgi:Kef-type K+ transport system membrane component KefB